MLDDAGTADAESLRAAQRGLRQVSHLRRQCDGLAPLAQAAFRAGSGNSEIALAAIRAHVFELEAMFESELAAGRLAPPQVRQQRCYDCIVKESVSTAWCPRRVVLSDAGFSLEDPAAPTAVGAVQPWDDVTDIDTGSSETHLHEAVLILRRSPGYLRLRFFHALPLRPLSEFWAARIKPSAGPTVPTVIDAVNQAWKESLASLVETLRDRDGRPATTLRSVASMPMGCGVGATPERVYDEIIRDDNENLILKVWRAKGVSEMEALPWEPLKAGGHVRGIRCRLPLKPRPMAPKSSRMVVAYHVTGRGERPVVLTVAARSLDVPYASSFEVQNQHCFGGLLPPEDGGIICEHKVGICWTGRCMVKSLIEAASRQETAEDAQGWIDQFCSSLRQGA